MIRKFFIQTLPHKISRIRSSQLSGAVHSIASQSRLIFFLTASFTASTCQIAQITNPAGRKRFHLSVPKLASKGNGRTGFTKRWMNTAFYTIHGKSGHENFDAQHPAAKIDCLGHVHSSCVHTQNDGDPNSECLQFRHWSNDRFHWTKKRPTGRMVNGKMLHRPVTTQLRKFRCCGWNYFQISELNLSGRVKANIHRSGNPGS